MTIYFMVQRVEDLWRMKVLLLCEWIAAYMQLHYGKDLNHPDLALELTGGEVSMGHYHLLDLVFIAATSKN